jgi:hypothetical protein
LWLAKTSSSAFEMNGCAGHGVMRVMDSDGRILLLNFAEVP